MESDPKNHDGVDHDDDPIQRPESRRDRGRTRTGLGCAAGGPEDERGQAEPEDAKWGSWMHRERRRA